MATRILLVSLFLSLLVACDKKEDDINPGKDYTGDLTLTYSRTFPTLQSIVGIDIEISKSGEVTFSSPQPITYDGISEKMIEGDRIKIREQGSITVASLSGQWVEVDGNEYLEVNLSCTLEGTQTVWAYEEYQWLKVSETPFTHENPVDCPMLFRVDNAVLSEAVCGANCCDVWGNTCFRWRLLLTPKI